MIDIAELKRLTHWDGIKRLKGGNGFLIEYDQPYRKIIQGITQTPDSLILTLKEVEDTPICIREYIGTSQIGFPKRFVEYWTMNRLLHREDGPAKFIYSPSILVDQPGVNANTSSSYSREWWKDGYQTTNSDGVLSESGKGYTVQSVSYGDQMYIREEFVEYKEKRLSADGSAPASVTWEGLNRLRLNGVICDAPDIPAIYAKRLILTWLREEPAKAFDPHEVELEEYVEKRNQDGSHISRTADMMAAHWIRTEEGSMSAIECGEICELALNMFEDIDLFGQFWRDETQRMLAIAAYSQKN